MVRGVHALRISHDFGIVHVMWMVIVTIITCFISQQLDGFPTVVNTTTTMDTTVELSELSGDSIYQINVTYTT